MSLLIYLTHPEVQIDPDIPVPQWGLSEKGRQRTEALKAAISLSKITKIVSSAEKKAIETAEIISQFVGIEPLTREEMHENDRSSTGFIKPDRFEEMADSFFAEPEESVLGWERAIDAQKRIVSVSNEMIASHKSGDLLFVGHGGVGTLLYCYFAREAIDRKHDQPAGGGNYFVVDLTNLKPITEWRSMETLLQPDWK